MPEGYIVRPLTPREWQWAYRGAWRGIGDATAFLKDNSGGRAHLTRSGAPNALGIFDMGGNLREMTIPDPETRRGNAIDLCGGGYDSPDDRRDMPGQVPPYQFLDPHIGARVAIAPGGMDFFDREYWVGDPRQIEFAQKRYELLAANSALADGTWKYRVCELLGGHLATPDDPELLKRLFAEFHELGSFPTAIDGRPENGRWLRPDGAPWRYAPMPGMPKHKLWHLVIYQKKIQCVYWKMLPGVLCEWTAEEYARRTDLARILRSPGVLHSWRDGGKMYVLIEYPWIPMPLARRLCELLGGRPAEPRTEEIRARMLRELAKWHDKPIILGGLRKYGQWRFHDGEELKMPLELREKILDSLNLASPGLLDGKFCALQRGQAFLVEIPL